MDENPGKENGQATIPGLTPYEKMPLAMQKLWEERLFNLVKQRSSLLVGDAVLSWAFVVWVSFGMLASVLYSWDTARFPVHLSFCYALAGFFVYYVVIGFVRRQTDRNLILLSAQHRDPDYHKSNEFKNKKPYRKEDDPPVARFAFRLRSYIGLPRRGLAQGFIVLWQFIAGFCYIVNYAYYVLYVGDISPARFPELLWILHTTITGGGILILFKNYGFLVDTNRLIKSIESLAESVFGHVTIATEEQKPCNGTPDPVNKQ